MQKNKKSFFKSFFSIFKTRKKIEDLVDNTVIVTPTRAIFNNFFGNKLAVFGLFTFIGLVLFILIGAKLNPVNFYYNEPELKNIAPGLNNLKIPQELQHNLQRLESGTAFSAAIDKEGKFYVWGSNINGVLNVPEKVKESKIEDMLVGDSFIIVKLQSGEFVGWGNNLAGQAEVPASYASLVVGNTQQMFAGKDIVGVVTKNGKAYVWGDQSQGQDIVSEDWMGRIVKATAGKFNVLYLLDDGSLRISGKGYVASQMPTELTDGSVRVIDMAINKNNAIALTEDGKVITWGNSGSKLLLNENSPVIDKIVQVRGGYNAFALLTEDGRVIMIGDNVLHELEVPEFETSITRLYGGYFQFFAEDKNGKIYAWGNPGFILGSDELGRDLLTRIFHGGSVSLFVGVIAVVISSIIGLTAGLISGFVGGWIDNLIQRIGEIISSIPFLPLVMTLSFAIGNKMTAIQKMYLVMMLIGVLSWVGLSRLVRAQILVEREKDFVLAARALGLKESTIIFKHILPSVLNIAIVSITLSYAGTMLTESALSFLGFGVQTPIPSWGNMLTSAQNANVIDNYWWRWVFPTMMIIIAVLSINLIGDGFREAMDPKSNDE